MENWNLKWGNLMKKAIFSVFSIVILMVGIFIYFDFNERKNSFNTPEEALKNIKKPKYEVIELIDTKMNRAEDYAYVFYYSQIEEPKDFFAISEFEKNKYGWKFNEVYQGILLSSLKNGSGYVINENKNDDKHYLYGIASSDVTNVELGMQVAELIPLKDKDLKMWIIFNPSSKDLDSDLQFLNSSGEILN